jgi:23S rRNA (uridine2552-2'-O)-methyltransferase|tara:strand:- start:1088 stop:1708 length:621 start_codon:yes stop_codon:yes gene_type:complete
VAKSASSNRWLERQSQDKFVKQRLKDGFRSRSAYKLQDINARFKVLRKGATVIDLGAAPGGWAQVAMSAVGKKGGVLAIDLLDMDPLQGAVLIKGDCKDEKIMAKISDELQGRKVDVILSDMAPNMSGIMLQDEAASLALAETALSFALELLKEKGTFILKLFEYPDTNFFYQGLIPLFGKVSRYKPEASRAKSREFYVVAQRFSI